jgi:hypothetical protein
LFSHVYKKIHIVTKECDWLISRKYCGSTSTKKLRLIIIGFDTPANNNGNKDNNILTIAFLASDARNAGKGGGGGSGDCHCHPPRVLVMKPLPPPPPAMAPRTSTASLALLPPPLPTMPPKSLPSFSEHCSPPKWTYPGTPRRPYLLRAHQQRNSQVRLHPGPPLLCSGPSSLQLLLSRPQGARAMPPPWQTYAGRWSSWPS